MVPTTAPSRTVAASTSQVGLYVALLAAALLRFWALGAHLPFSPGVDEPEVMERAVRIMKTGDFNPHFFDYPSLYIYVQAAAATLRFLDGATQGRWSALAQAPTEDFYLWGRAVTAMFGAATVWLTYRVGLYWNRRTALFAAAMMAVMPLHVRESHYTLTDVPATFFVMLTLLFSLRARERATVWSFILAGAAAGLAGATKYNAGLAVILPLAGCALTPAVRPSRAAAILWAGIAALVAFLCAAPYTLLDLPHFLNGFAYLASEYRAPLVGGDPVWIREIKWMKIALGWPGSVIVLAGLGVAGVRIAIGPDRITWVLVTIFPLVYFLFVARQNLFFARYLLPLIPSLSLLGAASVVGITDAVRRTTASHPARQLVAAALTLLIVVPPAYASIRFNATESRVWTTDQAYTWILRQLPKGTSIRFEGSGPIHLPPDYKASYVTQLGKWDLDTYRREGVQYLVASSRIFGPYLDDAAHYPEENRQYRRLFERTEEVARFTGSAEHPGPELRILRVK